jgi:tetratricopeptide (TPR) repeat protein
MCGGDLISKEGSSLAICDRCGTQQTISGATDEQKANLFNRANHLRRSGDFDRALMAYENLLNIDDRDAEAHWGLLLSRYGIEYVDDPLTHERLPTCHRVQNDSILTDPDYKAALEYATDSGVRNHYENEAKKIAQLQQDILALSSQEEPYDVFICYKETSDAGTRTKDSVLAQDIYYVLEREGYRVFFSRITLENKLGRQYEPYIFAAINSSKVMLVVGTKPEHFNAVWVKNEWSRYLTLKKKDNLKLLIPCYQGMTPYDLPEELSILQSLDMDRISFIQDVLYSVGKSVRTTKHETLAIVKKEAVEYINIEPLYKRAVIYLEDRDWAQAGEYFDRILDQDPEYAPAYIGKLCAELNIQREEDLAGLQTSIVDKKNFINALRFGNLRQRERYKAYSQSIQNNIEQEQLERRLKTEEEQKKTKHWAEKNLKELDILKNSFEIEMDQITRKKQFEITKLNSLGFFKFSERNATQKAIADFDNELKKKQAEYNDIVIKIQLFKCPFISDDKNLESMKLGNYEWRIVTVESGRALLITKDIVEIRPYNSEFRITTWEKCAMRSYLNDEFYNKFTEEEKKYILNSQNSNGENPPFFVDAGHDTLDNVFLLSLEEIHQYFKTNEDRRACYEEKETEWWLRSPGEYGYRAVVVRPDGGIHFIGRNVSGDLSSCGLRPALWLKL